MKKIIVDNNAIGLKLLKFLERSLRDVPHSALRKAIRNKDVKVNGKRVKQNDYIIKDGDEIFVYGLESKEKTFDKLSSYDLKVAYEDDNILVAYKPKGIVVHGTKDCLDNVVKSYLLDNNKWEVNGSFIPSHCHRLDKWTDGLVIYGLNYNSLKQINELMKDHTLIEKSYLAVVEGKLNIDKEVNGYIKELEDGVIFLENSEDNTKSASTIFKTLSSNDKESKLLCKLKTGRKHQIRVTLKHLGHPIKGDNRYNEKSRDDMQLQAVEIKFNNIEGKLSYLTNKIIKL